jgi:hypothetical protein
MILACLMHTILYILIEISAKIGQLFVLGNKQGILFQTKDSSLHWCRRTARQFQSKNAKVHSVKNMSKIQSGKETNQEKRSATSAFDIHRNITYVPM